MKPISIDLELPINSYSIHIDQSWEGLNKAIKPFIGHKAMVVTDENVDELFSRDIDFILKSIGSQVTLAVVKPGEDSKSLKTAESLYTQALKNGLDRSSAIIALGGGVVGDLAGFIAATYMRGINYVQIPTTLLAQVDSSVGGKVAVNHPLAKNIIGSFYQPKSVYINIDTLKSLPDRQFSTGMAELIKYGFIWDSEFLIWLQKNIDRIMERQEEALAYAIGCCCRTKAHIVSQDEREKGLRTILNFGHTIGHGLESLTNYKLYTHGEAVALGMVYESSIAYQMGLVDRSMLDLLIWFLEKANLPTEIHGVDTESLMRAMAHDKKNKDDSIVFVLPVGTGKVDVFNNLDIKLVHEVFKESPKNYSIDN
ncbi:MAG: 3-dehydroquinate synthase [Caldicoprobacterales bacterium]|mgnify:CR=1 FL=1|jgi:3-dehydroquinate synthase|nr:3-dehydroquinate synthase [Clostridiales bacterium]